MLFETLRCAVNGPIATITLNRPQSLNTILPPMPDAIEAAVTAAVRDPEVKVIGQWDPGKDFVFATGPALAPTW